MINTVPTTTWRIELLHHDTAQAYDVLVADALCTSLSHTLEWRDLLSDLKMGDPLYWLAYQSDELIGALPAFVQRSDLGSVLNSLPFIQSTGGVIGRDGLDREQRASLVEALVSAMLAWCRSNGVQLACVVGSAFCGQGDDASYPETPDFRWERPVRVIDLSQPLILRSGVRGSIIKAERSSPTLRNAGTLDEARLVYNICSDSLQRLGVQPPAWAFYESLFRRAVQRGLARFSWAEVDGKPVSGVVTLWHGGIVDYFSAGSTEAGREIQAHSWLCYQLLQAAQSSGFRWWNWMASPSQPVYDFKKSWGGMDRTYVLTLWRVGDITTLLPLLPEQLHLLYPGYFVLPYTWLRIPSWIP